MCFIDGNGDVLLRIFCVNFYKFNDWILKWKNYS